MALNFYGNQEDAVEMAGSGVSEDDAEMSMLEAINNWIDTKVNQDRFIESDEITEYHSFADTGKTELMLNKCPVVSGSLTLYDDVNNSTPVTVDSSCYYLDLETGIIQLLKDKTLTGSNVITEFTKGTHSVKVVYKYGYSTVPIDIKRFATLLLAKWLKLRNQQADANGLSKIQIGDYSESYDMKFMNIQSEFDPEINDLFPKLVSKYFKGY